MTLSPPDHNPFLRRSWLRRAKDALKVVPKLPGLAYQSFRTWPLALRQLVLIVGVIALGWGAYVGVKFYQTRSRNHAVMQEFNAFNNAINSGAERDELVKKLDTILELAPQHREATIYRQALVTGEADPSDSMVYKLVIREHSRANRSEEVIRETKRRLAHENKDYYAHSILAKAYLNKLGKANDALIAANAAKDPAAAESAKNAMERHLAELEPELNALANPSLNNKHLDFDALMTSLHVLRLFNKDLTSVRNVIADVGLKFIKLDSNQQAPPAMQVSLVYLYSEIFELPNIPPDASQYWTYACRLMELALDGARQKGDIQSAGQLATLGPKLANGLTRMRASSQLTDPQFVDATNELNDRVVRAWTLVLEKDPKNAQAHLGMVDSVFRKGDVREINDTLENAFKAVGDDPQLYQRFTHLCNATGNGMVGYNRLKAAAERNPKQSLYWFLAAQNASSANRRDLVELSLDQARRASPDDLNVAGMTAMFYAPTGHPELVLKALAAVPDEKLLKTIPGATPYFTRALAEIGDTERLDAFLTHALELGKTLNTAEPVILAARGVLEADNTGPAKAQQLADYLRPAVERWRMEFPLVGAQQALALAKAAEADDGKVDVAKSRQAILALQRALSQDPKNTAINPVMNTQMRVAMVDLRVRGDKADKQALYDLEPLVPKLKDMTLKAEQAELVGKVYVLNKKYEDAIRVLIPYTASRAPTAGCWTQLGLAYHGQGRTAEATDALNRASQLTMSDRERTEYTSAREVLTREKQ